MGVCFVYGDLLKTKDVDAIVHQVNCVLDHMVYPNRLLRHFSKQKKSFRFRWRTTIKSDSIFYSSELQHHTKKDNSN